jgi:hypothetical protein
MQWALIRHSTPKFTRLTDSLVIVPATATWDMAIVSKTGPTIGMGLPELRVCRGPIPQVPWAVENGWGT